MSQWLRVLADLPSILMGLLASSRRSDILFWPPRAHPRMCIYSHKDIYIKNIKNTYFELKKNQHRKLVRWPGRHPWNNPENS